MTEGAIGRKVFNVSKETFSSWMNGHVTPEARNLITAAKEVYSADTYEGTYEAFENDFVSSFHYLERRQNEAVEPNERIPRLARKFLIDLGELLPPHLHSADAPNAEKTLNAETGPQAGTSVANSPTAPFKWPPHVDEEDAFSDTADVDLWLNPHNHHSIALKGRDDEKRLLDEFANADRLALSICELIAPSGAGKTRLVSQWMKGYMAQYQANGWDAGFVDSRDPEPWKIWAPTHHTVIVIDYTHNYDAVTGVLIERFQRTAPKKIRLLLIDHVRSRDRNDSLALPEHMRDRQFLQGARGLYHPTSPIVLKPDSDGTLLLRHVIAEAADPNSLKKRYGPDDAPVIRATEALMKIGAPDTDTPTAAEIRIRDSVRHPLFAALFGQRLRDDLNADFSNITRRDLITQYFERGQRLPWASPKQNKFATSLGPWVGCYVSAATLLRGAAIRDLENRLPFEKVRKRLSKKNLLTTLAKLSRKIVSGAEDQALEPFTPDILGEAFVLMFLERFRSDDDVIDAFIALLGGQRSLKAREDAAGVVFETLQRLVRNLINEDQRLVEASWDALFRFLQPTRFPIGTPIRQVVSIALGDIAKQCSAAELGERIPEAMLNVDLEDLEAASAGPQWNPAAIAAVHYLEWAVSTGNVEDAKLSAIKNILANFKERSEKHWPALMLACAEGCLEAAKIVREMFQERVSDQQDEGWTVLMVSAYEGHAHVVKWLVDEGADPTETGLEDGWTAMVLACLTGHLGVVEYLHGENEQLIVATMENGATAMMTACQNGHLGVVEYLHGENDQLVAVSMEDGWTAMMSACQEGHLAVVAYLHGHDDQLIAAAKEDGWTAMMAACQEGHLAVVEYLHGQDDQLITAVKDDGWTAMMAACLNGHLAVMEYLHGQDEQLIAASMENGMTAMMLACQNDHLAVVEYLHGQNDRLIAATSRDGGTAMMLACQNGHLGVVEYLHGENDQLIAATREDGGTAMMAACWNGNLGVVEYLHGENDQLIAATREDGGTAMMAACCNGHLGVVEYLHGENDQLIAASMENGGTAMMLACQNGHLGVVEYLHGESDQLIAATMENGGTALMSACERGHLGVVEYLHGENDQLIAATREDGWTAMMSACQNGHLGVVEYLHGENDQLIAASSKDGWTAMMSACQNGHLGVVEFLFDAASDVHAITNAGTTALMLASQKGHLEIVACLRGDQPEEYIKTALASFGRSIKAGNDPAKVGRAVMSFLDAKGAVRTPEISRLAHASSSDEWADTPPISGEWNDLEEVETLCASIASSLASDVFPEAFAGKTLVRARSTSLAFYPGVQLLDLQCCDEASGEPLIASALLSGSKALLLDGKVQRLHLLNPFKLDLSTNKARADYLRFFCAFNRREEGPFEIVEHFDNIPFAGDTARSALLEKMSELCSVTPFEMSDVKTYGLRSCVLYGTALHKVDFKISPTGQVEIIDVDTLAEDLAVRRRAYDGIFRSALDVQG